MFIHPKKKYFWGDRNDISKQNSITRRHTRAHLARQSEAYALGNCIQALHCRQHLQVYERLEFIHSQAVFRRMEILKQVGELRAQPTRIVRMHALDKTVHQPEAYGQCKQFGLLRFRVCVLDSG